MRRLTITILLILGWPLASAEGREIPVPENRAEGDMFRLLHDPFSRLPKAPDKKSDNQRSLESRRLQQAFDGAPPKIPHGIRRDMDPLKRRCLSCHMKAGYIQTMEAVSPASPHPEWAHCQQCHVPDRFPPPDPIRSGAGSDWVRRPPVARGIVIQPAGPPVIPHSLQMRSHCQSCHVGKGAVDAIRTSHPERIHCRQCHVPGAADAPGWQRGGAR